MIREEAYRRLERDGAFTDSRSEWIQSVTAYLLEYLVSAKGIDFKELNDFIERGGWELKRQPPKTQEEIEQEEDEMNRRFIKSLGCIYGKKGG